MPSHIRGRHNRMSLVLAFDCAVSGLAVAVVRDGVRVASLREEGRDQAARLLPAIAATLAEARVEPKALALIAVTIGPGSFTGVRVGLAAARALAFGLNIPLAGIPTTRTLLAQAARDDRFAVAAIDSRLDDWFVATEDACDRSFVASREQLADRLRGRRSVIVGSGVEELASGLRDVGLDVVAQPASPDAAVLADLALRDGITAWRRRNEQEGLPRPLYLRGVNITLPDGARRTVE
jgi:tRNA threonylcarbamoyladenosine biosynthesis protein TsaB